MSLGNALTFTRGNYWYQKRRHDVICDAGDVVGAPVYVSGGMVGDSVVVSSADPSDKNKMPAIGVLVEKSNQTTGKMITNGPVDVYSGLQIGKTYYVVYGSISVDDPGGGQAIGYSISDSILVLPGEISQRFDPDTILVDDNTGEILIDENGNVLVDET